MQISYENIVEVNKGITYTDVRNKKYAEVAQRVQAFRKLFPGGYITTDIIKFDPGIVYMKAEAGYYEHGSRVMLATGYAFERQDASNINKTSFIENCETSAIGRALGFMGLGSENTICSAEELQNAIATQDAIEKGLISDPTKPIKPSAPADVEKVPSVPPVPENAPSNAPQSAPPADPLPPVLEYLARERKGLQEARRIDKAENAALWKKQIEVLTAAGIVPNKKLSEFTMKEAENLVNAMYTRFTPTGTELVSNDGQTA
jgi:hypothetical protein